MLQSLSWTWLSYWTTTCPISHCSRSDCPPATDPAAPPLGSPCTDSASSVSLSSVLCVPELFQGAAISTPLEPGPLRLCREAGKPPPLPWFLFCQSTCTSRCFVLSVRYRTGTGFLHGRNTSCPREGPVFILQRKFTLGQAWLLLPVHGPEGHFPY